jgi:hypothetical protein
MGTFILCPFSPPVKKIRVKRVRCPLKELEGGKTG